MNAICSMLLFSSLLILPALGAQRPNVVYLLADDMGYGDIQKLHARGKIPTPNLNKLREAGMLFTEAHSGSSVCTPTRYGIMTGRYAWRGKLKQGVIKAYAPPLIEEGRKTVADLFIPSCNWKHYQD